MQMTNEYWNPYSLLNVYKFNLDKRSMLTAQRSLPNLSITDDVISTLLITTCNFKTTYANQITNHFVPGGKVKTTSWSSLTTVTNSLLSVNCHVSTLFVKQSFTSRIWLMLARTIIELTKLLPSEVFWTEPID